MEGSAVLSRRGANRSRRAGIRAPFVQRYWAFLSYSHADAADAAWLHGAVEKFQVPRELVGRRTERFLVPKRLTPIFRDRSELAASKDLSQEIKEAIECSRHLIVLCSPAAARSRWVNEEVRAFKKLRPDGEVLAAILAGEPHASSLPGREAEECFPPAMRERFDARGRATGEPAEPIAADLREGADGRRGGLLKLVAGMLDVRLDELVQREEHRRSRKMAFVTAASIAGMALTSTLAVTAIQARDSARDQRREAESLVGFMIGDLKDKLEPVGRLDALDAVGARVLAFYERQDKGDLSDEALSQRSRALTLMGDIAQRRGDLHRAVRLHGEALAGTAEALRRNPKNPQRLFDHAQNVFWVGGIAMQRGRFDEAAAHWSEYRRLADRMITVEPNEPEWQLEAIYAESNLGALELQRRRYDAAVNRFARSLRPLEGLIARDPRNNAYRKLRAENVGYLSDSLERSLRLQPALAQRLRQLALLRELQGESPADTDLQSRILIAYRSMARQLSAIGRREDALRYSAAAVELSDLLLRTEPRNRDWVERSAGTYLDHARLLLDFDRVEEGERWVRSGCSRTAELPAQDEVLNWRRLERSCLEAQARLSLASGAKGQAMSFTGQWLAAVQRHGSNDPVEDRLSLAAAQLLSGDIQQALGDRDAALAAWRQALAVWPTGIAETSRELKRRQQLLERLGRSAEAAVISMRLKQAGWQE
ncbi:MAG TPA: TIR domain-containing protein [Sphingomicrobium sp.]|nr:TIR domain-containing protein [Sphingomicrobium sp.]